MLFRVLIHISSESHLSDIAKMGLEFMKEAGNHQTNVQAAAQTVNSQINADARGKENVRDREGDQSSTKKTSDTHIPIKTRQSSRIQDNAEAILKKAIAGKAKAKGIISSSIPPPPISSGSLDLLASVCGFSLGSDEASRIANILWYKLRRRLCWPSRTPNTRFVQILRVLREQQLMRVLCQDRAIL